MNMNSPNRKAAARLLTFLAVAIAASSTLQAATALEGRISVRPLTPQEKKDYAVTTLQVASGLSTVGIGQPAHLEALINKEIAPASIVGVTWTLTTRPIGSVAALEASPLGANVPTYKMVDRESFQVAGRTFLRPDVAGEYVVSAAIATSDSGTTNVSQKITAGTYMGANTCALCHSGGVVAENKYTQWSQTRHASLFTRGIDGIASDHYGANCVSCHTVGYDVNTNAVNGGFDDVAKQLGWTLPAVQTNGNWAATAPALKNVANIQCENCHGPGSQHAFSLGDVSKISTTFDSGNCAQCHASKNNHVKNIEWDNSRHAIAVEETEASCARCHSAKGFANFANGAPATETHYDVISCAACHDPHNAANPHQLRGTNAVALMDKKTVVTEGGAGLMCMNCHISRRDATNYVDVTAGSSRFGPHHGPQTDMLVGANAVTYGKVIPSSAHREVVEDSCAECHMQAVAATSPAFLKAGGHTFKMGWEGDATNAPVHLVGACVTCHGDVENFDFPRQDFDGDGIVDGVQTEVKHLLAKLAFMLPPVGTPKTALSIGSTWTKPQLKAAYNYQFVLEDGSYGVHNLAYAVGLLKASIADLSGDANNDGIADWWQNQFFGSINAANAGANATPAGDGIPNWLKFNLGLDPNVAGMTVPGGVVWVSGKTIGNASATNTVQIYTAAEVAFNTEVGKSYQLQAISSLGGGWQNIGAPMQGTGSAISYVTPTRQNVQQFYRVAHTP